MTFVEALMEVLFIFSNLAFIALCCFAFVAAIALIIFGFVGPKKWHKLYSIPLSIMGVILIFATMIWCSNNISGYETPVAHRYFELKK